MIKVSNKRGLPLSNLWYTLHPRASCSACGAQDAGQDGESKVKAAKAQIELLGTALDSFHLDIGRYPTTQEGCRP